MEKQKDRKNEKWREGEREREDGERKKGGGGTRETDGESCRGRVKGGGERQSALCKRERDRQTERQTERQRQRERGRKKGKERERWREKKRERERGKWETDRRMKAYLYRDRTVANHNPKAQCSLFSKTTNRCTCSPETGVPVTVT